ncbi:MAG: TIGR03790 family protein [Bacteroidota bacterium]
MKTTVYTIIAIAIFSLLVNSSVLAQTATYNDVAIIINSNSAASEEIGMYFAGKRSIHNENIIRISAPVTEEIDSVQFEQLRAQVESYLVTNGLVNSINYLVTTKGVPLKVKRFDVLRCSSVESELSLILGSYSSSIGNNGRVTSPYYRQRNNFTRQQYGIYLVARLDGYTVADVKSLIDRADVIDTHLPESGKFVFDMDPSWNSAAPYLNTRMKTANDTLIKRSMSVTLDQTSTYLVNQQQVNGYVGWGTNDKYSSYHGLLNFTWNPGAIAETYVSTSGRTFSAPAVYGQSLIADIISEGVTAAKGYVYEPYSSAMADVSMLFDLYTDGYTVAESYYSSSPFLSWMDVVVGDPKFRLVGTRLPADAVSSGDNQNADALPVELTSFSAHVVNGSVELLWNTATEMNNRGFEVERKAADSWNKVGFIEGNGTSNSPKSYSFIDNSVNGGTYSYRLKQIDRNGSFTYSTIVSVNAPVREQSFALGQNYPNPFNPSTTINFAVKQAEQTTIKVYSITGQEVATLFNDVAQPGQVYNMKFDGKNLSSGTYIYTLRSASRNEVRKMQLMK